MVGLHDLGECCECLFARLGLQLCEREASEILLARGERRRCQLGGGAD